MRGRQRSHSYTGPSIARDAHPIPNEVPHLPVQAHIRHVDRDSHNLRVLQRHDPNIVSILEQIPYAALRLLRPGARANENPDYWEKEMDGPEGPLFIVERSVRRSQMAWMLIQRLSRSDDSDSTLAFAVLGTKHLPSWVQPLHRDDEIEFSPYMIFIVPRSQKHGGSR